MAPAAFKKPPQAPPVFTGTAESIVEDAKRVVERSRSLHDELVKRVKPEEATFENVLRPLALDEGTAGLENRVLGFYQAVSTNQSVRDASTEADKLIDEFGIEASMREDLYKLVEAAYKKKDKLNPESQRLLEKERKDFIRNGLGLPNGPKRERFKAIKLRLSQISIAFQKNLNEEKGGLWFTPQELDGVPEDTLSTLTKGEGEHEGKLRLTFKYPDLLPTLDKCKNATTRQKVFISNENKCNSNVPLFKEAILLRDEAARLLGYPNHAAFRIEDKMAKTPGFVDEFQRDLRVRLTPGGEREVKLLKSLKDHDLKSRGLEGEVDGNYYFWDHRFYSNLMLERDYQLDQEKVAEYFPLRIAITRMLEIFEKLMGLRFVEVTGDDRAAISPSGSGKDIVWHEDVQLFSVWDEEAEGGGFVGYLYTDLHPREGKYGHAANFNMQPGYTAENGSRRYPATALVCNFSKPTAKKPSLLKHDELTTLFHELGHGIHDLVSRTQFARFHGTNTVQDFVEAPSKMLENWCWTPSQLRYLSKHYSTLTPEYHEAWKANAKPGAVPPPETMPSELIDSIVKTKHVNEALATLRQLHFGMYDMAVHEPESHAALEALDASVLYNEMRSAITPMKGPADVGLGYSATNGEATFGHLIGGYDAGYYGYMIAETYSSDMYHTVFAKDPMDPREGRRYRHTVLEKGGARDELESLTEFLGRRPNSDAFYRELGLK